MSLDAGHSGSGEADRAPWLFGASLRARSDSGLEVDEGMKDAALQSPAGEFGKKPFDSVEPGRRGRGEVERPTRVPGKPSPDFGVLVAAVVVEDHMDQPAGWDVALKAVEKTQEFLVPGALHALPDHRAVENIESGKQSGRAVADIIVSYGPGAARFHRQTRLGAVSGAGGVLDQHVGS